MGFLNEIKKVLFGAQSLGKSAVNQAVEKGKELGQSLQETSSELLEQAREKGAAVVEKAGDLLNAAFEGEDKKQPDPNAAVNPVDQTPPAATNPMPQALDALLASTPPPSPETTNRQLDFDRIDQPDQPGDQGTPRDPSVLEKLGSKVLDGSLEAGKKVEELAAKTGDQLLQVGEKVMEQVKGVAGQVGEVLLDQGSQLWEKAQQAGEQLREKTAALMDKADAEAAKAQPNDLDNLIAKAKEMGDRFEEKAQDTQRQFTDSLADAKKGGLEQHDDFFAKAKRFADGDHGAFSNETTIRRDPDHQPDQKGKKTHGFNDGDGDGEDLIDDAIIEK